jgi:hypothetical protein
MRGARAVFLHPLTALADAEGSIIMTFTGPLPATRRTAVGERRL